jgi:hypothetical protein
MSRKMCSISPSRHTWSVVYPLLSKRGTDIGIDIPRTVADIRWILVRHDRKTSNLHLLFRHLHYCQRRAGFFEQLCSTAASALPAEHWK